MDIKNLEEAKSIREKKKELEAKIAEIAKSDPERAKKMSIALTVLSGKADRMIGDGLGGDAAPVPLAPREEPITAPVAAKPYVAAVRKKIVGSKPVTTNGGLLKESDFDNMNKIIKGGNKKAAPAAEGSLLTESDFDKMNKVIEEGKLPEKKKRKSYLDHDRKPSYNRDRYFLN